MEGLRKFLNTSAGRIAGVVLVIGALALVVYVGRGVLGQSDIQEMSGSRFFICAETGKSFKHDLVLGETLPCDSPYSGKKTGWPAELCFWATDGKAKSDPTPVLLNDVVGKPGPTFCPDCGRLVVNLNPPPREGGKPPPTKSEYEASRKD